LVLWRLVQINSTMRSKYQCLLAKAIWFWAIYKFHKMIP
jgi:hypothetical protein